MKPLTFSPAVPTLAALTYCGLLLIGLTTLMTLAQVVYSGAQALPFLPYPGIHVFTPMLAGALQAVGVPQTETIALGSAVVVCLGLSGLYGLLLWRLMLVPSNPLLPPASTAVPLRAFSGLGTLASLVVLDWLIHTNLSIFTICVVALKLPFKRSALACLVLMGVGSEIETYVTHHWEMAGACNFTGFEDVLPDLSTEQAMALVSRPAQVLNFVATLALFLLGQLHRREHHRSTLLAMEHAQLQAAQALLAEAELVAERERLAHELHDGLGHHLTALCLHLNLAARSTEGTPQGTSLHAAHAQAQHLLADVRQAVRSDLNSHQTPSAFDATPHNPPPPLSP